MCTTRSAVFRLDAASEPNSPTTLHCADHDLHRRGTPMLAERLQPHTDSTVAGRKTTSMVRGSAVRVHKRASRKALQMGLSVVCQTQQRLAGTRRVHFGPGGTRGHARP